MLRWMMRGLIVTMAVTAFALGHARVAFDAPLASGHPSQSQSESAGSPRALFGFSGASADIITPVAGVETPALNDSFDEGRVGHIHHAIHILPPHGTPVLA